MIKKEEIKDEDSVFRRVPHWNWDLDNDCADAKAFDDPKMSVDWDKYSTLEETAARAGQARDGTKFGAVTLRVGFLRKPDTGKPDRSQDVIHDPQEENPAHSLVIGEKGLKLGRRISKHAKSLKTIAPVAKTRSF